MVGRQYRARCAEQPLQPGAQPPAPARGRLTAPGAIPAAPYLLGAAALLVGVVGARGEFARARGADRLALLAPLFVAIPMAVFGGDHFRYADSIAPIIPAWIPGHMFWVYFVGACLVAGGLAIAARIRVMLTLALFGTMMLLFVVLMHIGEVARAPGDRFAWGVLSRDATFGAGVLALVAARAPRSLLPAQRALDFARLVMGCAAVFWAVELVLHPDYRPGIALRQVMPAWMPLQAPVAWLSAGAMLVAGLGLLTGRHTNRAATLLGLLFLVLAVVLGVPITIGAPADIGGLNYLMDNLMMSGCALCLAAAATSRAS